MTTQNLALVLAAALLAGSCGGSSAPPPAPAPAPASIAGRPDRPTRPPAAGEYDVYELFARSEEGGMSYIRTGERVVAGETFQETVSTTVTGIGAAPSGSWRGRENLRQRFIASEIRRDGVRYGFEQDYMVYQYPSGVYAGREYYLGGDSKHEVVVKLSEMTTAYMRIGEGVRHYHTEAFNTFGPDRIERIFSRVGLSPGSTQGTASVCVTEDFVVLQRDSTAVPFEYSEELCIDIRQDGSTTGTGKYYFRDHTGSPKIPDYEQTVSAVGVYYDTFSLPDSRDPAFFGVLTTRIEPSHLRGTPQLLRMARWPMSRRYA